jgi:hypothetical protein
MLEAIGPELLARVAGGFRVQLTQFGYRNDPYMDSETRRGNGAYHHLVRDQSVALTDSTLHALGLTRRQAAHGDHWVELRLRGGGVLTRRIDDRAPERNRRADLYEPRGFDRHLPDHADIRLLR